MQFTPRIIIPIAPSAMYSSHGDRWLRLVGGVGGVIAVGLVEGVD